MNKAKHDRLVTLVSQILAEGSGSMHILPRGDIVVEMYIDDASILSQAVDMAARARLAAKLPTLPRPQ